MKKKSLYPSPGCRKIIHFLVMKASFIFLLLLTLQIKANVYAQQLRLDLNLQNVTLKEVIQEIRRHSDFSFVYSDADLVGITQRNVQMKDAMIEEVLKNCLQGTKLVYDITDKTIIIRKLDEVTQTKQVQVIQGQVTDVRGTPLPGVTVRIKGTQLGVSTDVNGKFRFELPDTKEVVLAFSFVGMKTKEVAWKGEKELNVTMEDEITEMEEVVVTGMFTRKANSYTGSVTTIKGDELKTVGNGRSCGNRYF